MAKLKSKRGETIVETLVAILIVVLTSSFFLTAVIATAKINKTANSADNSFRAAQEQVEKQENKQDGTVTITVGNQSKTYDVEVYGDGEELQGYTLK
jgi:type II secretory pathway pseudopilin PulG